MTQLTDKVSFDFIRYANCWEDPELLINGLNPHKGSKILSIGSAGDNSFSLLTTDPTLVMAVDVNKIQLHVIALKMAAIEHFDYHEVLSFLGFEPSTIRKEMFGQLKQYLSHEAQQYWQNNLDKIDLGIINQGKFESYFQLFSAKILPWIHHKIKVEKLLEPKSEAEQMDYYQTHWNTWRWRLFVKLFFSKYVMGKYGRDPVFLKEVRVAVGKNILKKTENHLQSIHAQKNFFLRYNLTGSFGHLLPHYLMPENYPKVKANLHKLELKEGYAESAFESHGSFDYMNLSNIFEYMNKDLFAQTAENIVHHTKPGGKLAYWNLMVPRSIAQIFPQKVEHAHELSEKLTALDKGFFYDKFNIDCVK